MPSLSKKRESELAKIKQLPPAEVDPHPNIHGVLLSDEIAFYAQNCHLISPFNQANLKPAAYELTIGDEYFLSGEFLVLDANSADQNKVTIPPFEVAVLKTAEILSIPRFLIARWNIRIKHVYSGLLWVGAPQVDPGYVGHLYCPIYNLSDKPVTLHVGEPFAVMDFVKTTPFVSETTSRYQEKYNFPPKRLILEDYGIDELRSALFTRAGEKLAEFETEIGNLGSRFITFTQISFAMFALIIGVVAISTRSGQDNLSMSASLLGASTIAFSVMALLVALFSAVSRRVGRLVHDQYGRVLGRKAADARRFVRRAWLWGMAISVLIAVLGGIAIYLFIDPFFVDLRQQRMLTKSDLDVVTTSVDKLSGRLDRIESIQPATAGDLAKLRATLEQQIHELKSR